MFIYSLTTSSSTNTNTLLFATASSADLVTNGTRTVTSATGAFLTQLKIGDRVKIGTNAYTTVTAIASNTSMTVLDIQPTATGQAIVLKPREFDGTNKVVFIRSISTNTGTIHIGESENAAKDGTDITTTSRSFSLLAQEVSVPLTVNSPENVYVRSDVASQRYQVIVNE